MGCTSAPIRQWSLRPRWLSPLLQPDLWFHRHAYAQTGNAVLVRFEPNSDRKALHYLDIVPGRVLGRQKTIARASGTRHVFDVAFEVMSQRVHANCHWLAGAHFSQLSLLVVGRDPNVV